MPRPQINLRVSNEQKSRWEQYVNESPEYDTLTDLIRISVEREIASEGAISAHSSGGNLSGEGIGEVLNVVNKMEGRLTELEDTLSHATDAMYSSGKGTDDFSTAVFSELPSEESNAKSASEIAMALGVETAEAAGTLESLRNETDLVYRNDPQITGRENPVYYRVE